MSDVDLVSTAPAQEPAPVAAIVATPPPEPTADQATPEGESPEAKPERTFTQKELDEILQKRIARESRRAERLADAKYRAEYAERQLAELRAPPKDDPASKGPQPENFKDYESYLDALTDWKVDQRLKGFEQGTRAQQESRIMAERANVVLPKLKTAMEKYDDFQDVATSFQAPAPTQAAMLESEHTGELYYYLGLHPEEVSRLASLSPVQQVKAVEALERKLVSAPSPTKTPAPIVPNNGNSKVSKSPSEMNYDEFAEYRRKRLARKR